MDAYDPKKIEPKWQVIWEKEKIYQAESPPAGGSKKPKFYSLIEFPFPSGDGMHTGHLRSNTAMDIISRKRRMQGFNVMYPIGWDAFGLPTENYAIKTGQHPKVVTKQNTDNFRRQLKSAGFSFDWSREINTSDPAYYKWTQWIFLQFFKHDLAYKKKMVVNWCPKDKIVLANEEVINGKCERCGTVVEKREKEQWMLAITKYADRLDKDLDTVDYLEKIKIQQRNWIGKSEGAVISFPILTRPSGTLSLAKERDGERIEVFTTRPDTLFGATYIVLAPEHELVQKLRNTISNIKEVEKYIHETKKKTEIERTAADKTKTGVELKGIKAVNPATKEKISIFVADYVLAHYGTGAIMAVPAHDERDYEFAEKYNLPIKEVVVPNIVDKRNPPVAGKKIVERKNIHAIVKDPKTGKYLALKWKKFDWLTFPMGGVEEGEDVVDAARREVREETGFINLKLIRVLPGQVRAEYFAAHKDQNRISLTTAVVFELENHAQEEINEEEKQNHEIVWLSQDQLNYESMTHAEVGLWNEKIVAKSPAYIGTGVLINSGKFSGMNSEEAKKVITEFVGGKIVTTYKLRDWVFSRQRYWGEPIPLIHCEKCGWVAVPEKDLPVELPEVKNYQPTDTGESPLAAISDWVNTTCPKCSGLAKRETDTMPNWAGSSWYFLRYTDPENKKEFADPKKLKYWMPVDWYNGGMEHTTLHLLYSRFWNKFLFDIGLVPTSEPYQKRTSHGLILATDGEKMSKSLGNTVNPDPIIKEQGADTLRVYEMFMGPFDQAVSWSTDGIVGPRRFLERVWRLQEKVNEKKSENKNLESLTHKTLKKVNQDIEDMQFNTAVSALMILTNEFEKAESVPKNLYEILLKMLAPFAPHITEEIWRNGEGIFGKKTSLHTEAWPETDESKMLEEAVTIIVQVNGKVRGNFSAAGGISQEEAEKKALELPEVQKWIGDKKPKKVIFVKGKLVSIVI